MKKDPFYGWRWVLWSIIGSLVGAAILVAIWR